MSKQASENDVRWWITWRGGELGLKAQNYESTHIAADGNGVLYDTMFGQRRRASRDWRRIEPVMREFTAAHPEAAHILAEAYTPRGFAEGLTMAREKLSLRGERHAVTLLHMAARSKKLAEARDKTRPSESLLEFLAWSAKTNDRLLNDVRDELGRILDGALALYDEVRDLHTPSVKAARAAEHEAWMAEQFGQAAAE